MRKPCGLMRIQNLLFDNYTVRFTFIARYVLVCKFAKDSENQTIIQAYFDAVIW